MTARMGWAVAAMLAVGACADARGLQQRNAAVGTTSAPLVGAWHLAWLDQPGPDGKIVRVTDARGSLIYTAEGVVAVQVMFAQAAASPTRAPVQYAANGYEASFGRYVIDSASHTVTHHYDGSLVRSLLGQDLPRRYDFVDGRLMIRSTRPDEKWSVAWERH